MADGTADCFAAGRRNGHHFRALRAGVLEIGVPLPAQLAGRNSDSN